MTQMLVLLGLIAMGIIALEMSLLGDARNKKCAILKFCFNTVLYLTEFQLIMFSIYYCAVYIYGDIVGSRGIAFFVGFIFIPLYVNYGRMILGEHTDIDTNDWFWWLLTGILSFGIILSWNIIIFNY